MASKLIRVSYNVFLAQIIALLPSPASQAVFSRIPKEVEPLDGLEAAVKHTWLSGVYQGCSIFGVSSATGYLIGGKDGLWIGVIFGQVGVIDGLLRMLVSQGINYGKGEREPKSAGFLEGYLRLVAASIGSYSNKKSR